MKYLLSTHILGQARSVAGLRIKGTYVGGLSWVAAKRVDLCIHHQNPALAGFSHFYCQVVSTTHYCHKAVSLQQLSVWQWWVECTFQGQRSGEEPLIRGDPLAGQLVGSDNASFLILSGILTSQNVRFRERTLAFLSSTTQSSP